jgi:hypothetical protein
MGAGGGGGGGTTTAEGRWQVTAMTRAVGLDGNFQRSSLCSPTLFHKFYEVPLEFVYIQSGEATIASLL